MLGGEFDLSGQCCGLDFHGLTTLCGYILAVGLDTYAVPTHIQKMKRTKLGDSLYCKHMIV